jgi:transcriptional regulator with XRE-family HTH domain
MDKLALRVGKKISQIRRRRNITAEKLAYENDISKSYISEIERGRKLPSLKMLTKIAEALDVDIKELF